MAISMMLSYPLPLNAKRLLSSSGRAAVLCGFVVVDVVDRVFERASVNAQAKASERQFWVVSKAGVDLGGAPKPTPRGSRVGLSVLTRILIQLVLLLLVTRRENVESCSSAQS
jgi:hypothetical protein